MSSKTNLLKSDSNKSDEKKGEATTKETLPMPKSEFSDTLHSNTATSSVSTANTGTKPKKNRSRNRTTLSIRRSLTGSASLNHLNATVLTFQPLSTNPRVARVQLLLCNISDRDIFAKLRCNTKSNVSALPASSGHISAKSQMRIMLNWKMPDNKDQWEDVALPKILLSTYFLHNGQKQTDEAPTNTRLVARVSSTKTCDASDPPIEQLLLDAVGKDTSETNADSKLQTRPSPTPEDSGSEKKPNKKEEDNKWIVLMLIAIILVLLLTKGEK